MIGLLWFVLAILVSPFRSKAWLEVEIAMVLQQLIVLQRKSRGQSSADSTAIRFAFRPASSWPYQRSPAGPDWLHEIKFDGYRVIIFRKRLRILFSCQHDY